MEVRGIVAEPVATVVGSADARPGAFVRAALLVQALVLIAVFVPFLLNHPPRQDAVTLDVFPAAADAAPAAHLVEIDPARRVRVDGREQADLAELRMALDLILVETTPSIELRPHPEARYEDVAEVLAAMARATVADLRIVTEEEALAGRFAL